MRIKQFLFTAVLVTAILCSAGFVSAQTTDDSALIAQLQAQIQSLMQQIQQLIAQQGGQGWCHTFNNYSVAGSTNGDVSSLQTALTKQGFDVSGDSQGTFGDNTAAAVVQFQGKNGIRQTGTVGPITRAKLNSLYGRGTNPTPTPTPTPTPNPTPTPICIPNVVCSAWSTCTNGQQTRTCTDSSNCTPGPITTQSCYSTQPAVTVSIDPSSPTSQSITANQTSWLAKFQLTNTTQNNIVISSLTFHELGTADISVLAGVKLYISTLGAALPNQPSINWNNGVANSISFINLSFSVPANGSVTVMTDITPPTSAQNGSTVGLAINSSSDVSASNSASLSQVSVSGSFPIASNLLTISNTTAPTITITSPNGAGSFTAGQSMPITFTTSGLAGKQIQFTLNNIDTNAGYGLASITNGYDGTQTVNEAIPATVPTGSRYTLSMSSTICGVESPTCVAEATSNGYFSIVGAPTITIISPNGSGSYTTGSSIPVTFITSGLAGKVIQFTFNNTDTHASYGAASITNGSDGTQTVNEFIPATVSAGSHYTISLSSTVCGTESPMCAPFANSNGFFTIIAAQPLGFSGVRNSSVNL